jgi:hypothetical protein
MSRSEPAYFVVLHTISHFAQSYLSCVTQGSGNKYNIYAPLLPPRSGHRKLYCSPGQGSLGRAKALHTTTHTHLSCTKSSSFHMSDFQVVLVTEFDPYAVANIMT